MEELKSFSLLQAQMQRRTEELQKLRLGLLPPASEKVELESSHDEPEVLTVTGTGLPLATSGMAQGPAALKLTGALQDGGETSQRTSGGPELLVHVGGTPLTLPVTQAPSTGRSMSDEGREPIGIGIMMLEDTRRQSDTLEERGGQRSGLASSDHLGEKANVPTGSDPMTEYHLSEETFGKSATRDIPGMVHGGRSHQCTPIPEVYTESSLVDKHTSDSRTSTPAMNGGTVTKQLHVSLNDSLSVRHSHSYSNLEQGREYLQNHTQSRSVPSIHIPGPKSTDRTLEILEPGMEGETATGRVLLDSLVKGSRLEVQLSHAQNQIQKLIAQINQLEQEHSEETRKNRGTIDGLLLRIDEITRNKQNQINERDNECRAKDQVITQLTKTLHDAETTVNVLEQTIAGTKQDLVQERERSTEKDQALLRIYQSVMGEGEEEGGDLSLTPHTVTERVKGYMEEREGRIRGLDHRLRESEAMCRGERENLGETVERLTAENKQRLSQLNEEHCKLMEAATERSMNARKQTLGLQAQLAAVEEHSRQELESKSKQIADLTERLKAETEKSDALRGQEHVKFAKSQEELQIASTDLEAKRTQVSQLEGQISLLRTEIKNLKDSLSAAEVSLEEEKVERSKVTALKNQSETDLKECRKLLEQRSADLEQMSARITEEGEEHKRKLETEVSLVRRESESRLSEEKANLAKTIEDHKKKLSDLEQEKNQIQDDLKNSVERNTSHLSRIRELESTLEIAAREKEDLAVILEGRDRDLLVLKHERELLESMLEKNRKESQVELRDRDAIQQSLNDIEPRYHKLLEENQRLSAELNQVREGSRKLETEKEELVRVVEKTKTEWEKVRELKNDIGKELHVKEASLKRLTEELKEAQSNSSEKASDIERMQERMDGLKRNCKDLKNEISQARKEKDEAHQRHLKHSAKAEKEKCLMSSQIKILQRELRTVRGTMKANQAVDGKAIEAAAGMKRDVVLQRDLVGSLQGEISWLEECLQESQRNHEKILVERNELRASLQTAEKRLIQSREDNREMSKRRKDLKGLVLKLEAALEKAALKYGESQQRNERQAQELARLRLQHQLELKELKGNLLSQLTTEFTMPKVDNHSPNNLKGTPTKKVEKPRNHAHSSTDDSVPNPSIQDDLRTLLQGVLESLLLQSKAGGSSLEEGGVQEHSPRRKYSTTKQHSRELIVPHPAQESTYERVPSTGRVKGGSSTHAGNIPAGLSTPLVDLPGSPDRLQTSSPVSMLLGKDTMQREVAQLDLDDTGTWKEPYDQGRASGPMRDTPSPDTKMRVFQEKLGQLAAMGSKLRAGNKEMELFLEDEDS